MNAPTQPIDFAPPLASEDRARADMYALLSRLFYGAPDEALLTSLARAGNLPAEDAAAPIAAAWRELVLAAGLADATALAFEYDEQFVGTGKAEVTLYAGAYLHAQRPLVGLRQALAARGLARRAGAGEAEDHVSALLDVMRVLIAGEGAGPPAGLEAQREFFIAQLAPWYGRFVDAIEASAGGEFYKSAGCFLRAFLDLEAESLGME